MKNGIKQQQIPNFPVMKKSVIFIIIAFLSLFKIYGQTNTIVDSIEIQKIDSMVMQIQNDTNLKTIRITGMNFRDENDMSKAFSISAFIQNENVVQISRYSNLSVLYFELSFPVYGLSIVDYFFDNGKLICIVEKTQVRGRIVDIKNKIYYKNNELLNPSCCYENPAIAIELLYNDFKGIYNVIKYLK